MIERDVKIDSKIINIFVIVFIIVIISSFIANLKVLRIYIRTKKHEKPVNFVCISLTILNFFTIIFYLTHYTTGLYFRRIPFGDIGCVIEGFFAFFTGVASLWLLALLSINRYCLVFYPINMNSLSVKGMLKIISVYLIVNICWSLMPIIGWSKYTYEFNGLQCVMDYSDHTFPVISFNVCTLLFFWLIPISIGCYTNFNILLILKNRSKQMEYLYFAHNNADMHRKKLNQLLIVVILNVSYIISWLPYAFIMFYGSFYDANNLSPLLPIIGILLAKSIVLWGPILEILLNVDVRKNLVFYHTSQLEDKYTNRVQKDKTDSQENSLIMRI